MICGSCYTGREIFLVHLEATSVQLEGSSPRVSKEERRDEEL